MSAKDKILPVPQDSKNLESEVPESDLLVFNSSGTCCMIALIVFFTFFAGMICLIFVLSKEIVGLIVVVIIYLFAILIILCCNNTKEVIGIDFKRNIIFYKNCYACNSCHDFAGKVMELDSIKKGYICYISDEGTNAKGRRTGYYSSVVFINGRGAEEKFYSSISTETEARKIRDFLRVKLEGRFDQMFKPGKLYEDYLKSGTYKHPHYPCADVDLTGLPAWKVAALQQAGGSLYENEMGAMPYGNNGMMYGNNPGMVYGTPMVGNPGMAYGVNQQPYYGNNMNMSGLNTSGMSNQPFYNTGY